MTQLNTNRYIIWNLEKTSGIVTCNKGDADDLISQEETESNPHGDTLYVSEFLDDFNGDNAFFESFNPDNHFRMVLPHNFGSAIVRTQDDGKFSVWIETGPTHGDGYYVQKDIDNFIDAVRMITDDILGHIKISIAEQLQKLPSPEALKKSAEKFYRNAFSGKFKLPET